MLQQPTGTTAAREGEPRYSRFVQQGGDVVFTVDAAGTFTSINHAAEQLSGYTQAEALGLKIQDVVAPEHADLVQEMLQAKLRGEVETTRYAVALITKDGRRLELEISTWLGLRDSQSIEVRGIVRDPAELQQRLAREQEARAEVEAVLRARDELLSGAAHELRTPLATILGHVEQLRETLGATEAAGRSLAAIERQARRLGRLIEELLEVSRLELGRLELYRRALELGELAAEVVADQRAASPGHRLVLERAGPVWVEGDGYRIEQVLLNLLGNATKFSPEGTDVTVTVETREGEAVVAVRDRGIGIPAERQAGLFERFHRAHAGMAHDPGGLGLGLYICRAFVERHGGRIWCESAEGQGATFWFSLPLAESEGHDGGAGRPGQERAGGGR